MTIKEQINVDFMTAFKAKDMTKKNFLGLLKSDIQAAETREGFKGEETILSIIKKMEKSLKITGDADSLNELTYLKVYLPSLMSEDEITKIVTTFISENEGTQMGPIMGFLKSNYGGQYDGKMASTIVKSLV